MQKNIKNLDSKLKSQFYYNFDIGKLTWFRTGGKSKLFIIVENENELEVILNEIIPKNIAIQIHTALLENLASEQGSRMTAMDNATRNANDMIDNLTLFYNRSRQALITKELIEIISGAEAV